MDCNLWLITREDRVKHDQQFEQLNPINGYIYGDILKEFFIKSRLNKQALAQIWKLADLNRDGKMDKKEFSIAMFLIKKCLLGAILPENLPKSLLTESPVTYSNPIIANGSSFPSDWSISNFKMLEYKSIFNNEKNKEDLIYGDKGTELLSKSKLPTSVLARIWALSDIDMDGKLNEYEFCLAMHLVDISKSGYILPSVLPKELSSKEINNVALENILTSSFKLDSFEIKRRQNIKDGEAELERRRQIANNVISEENKIVNEYAAKNSKNLFWNQERNYTVTESVDLQIEEDRKKEWFAQQERLVQLHTIQKERQDKETIRQLEVDKKRIAILQKEKQNQSSLLDILKKDVNQLDFLLNNHDKKKLDLLSLMKESKDKIAILANKIDLMKNNRNSKNKLIDDLQNDIEKEKLNANFSKQKLIKLQKQIENLSYQEGKEYITLKLKYDNFNKQLKRIRLNCQKEEKLNELLEVEKNYLINMLDSHLNYDKSKESVEITSSRNNKNKINNDLHLELASTNSLHKNETKVNVERLPYIALFNFEARNQDELTINKGDIIYISKSDEDTASTGWLYCERNGLFGWVPKDYLTINATYITPDLLNSDNSISEALPELNSSDEFRDSPELYFNIKEIPEVYSNAQEVFSKNKLVVLPHEEIYESIDEDDKLHHKKQFVRALYDYLALREDELTFYTGDIIEVVGKDNNDWWRGLCHDDNGLFPSTYVELLPSDFKININNKNTKEDFVETKLCEPNTSQRNLRILELIETEESYVEDLTTVIECFYKPLKIEKILTSDEMKVMFINMKDIRTCNHRFYKALRNLRKTKKNEIEKIGDVICAHLKTMDDSYIKYCSGQLIAAALLQKKYEMDTKFRDCHKKCCQNERTKGMPLSSFLLKPMQRVTKYPLLIQKIVQLTTTDHIDYKSIFEAEKMATELCQHVNEGVREKENSDRLEWLQKKINCDILNEKINFNSETNMMGHRRYLHSGVLYKTKNNKELIGILFNDFLLLCIPNKLIGQHINSIFNLDGKSSIQFKLYKNPYMLNDLNVQCMQALDSSDSDCSFQITISDSSPIILKTISSNDCLSWINKISAAAKSYRNQEKIKNESINDSSTQQSAQQIGRLLVVIVDAVNLSSNKGDIFCEVQLGNQQCNTPLVQNTGSPKFNHSLQFNVFNLQTEVLKIGLFLREMYSPNKSLGRTELCLIDLSQELQFSRGPSLKQLLLRDTKSGELTIRIDLQLFVKSSNYGDSFLNGF